MGSAIKIAGTLILVLAMFYIVFGAVYAVGLFDTLGQMAPIIIGSLIVIALGELTSQINRISSLLENK